MTAPVSPTLTGARPARPAAAKAGAGDANAIAAQAKAFDATQAENAELLREREALESMMQAELKDEDAVMKKWIAMIA